MKSHPTDSQYFEYLFPLFQGKGPKAVINIKDLNATFQTEKIGNPHGLQITYKREGHLRNLFVYHESGKVRSLALHTTSSSAPQDSAGPAHLQSCSAAS